jgi:hypothetical protein
MRVSSALRPGFAPRNLQLSRPPRHTLPAQRRSGGRAARLCTCSAGVLELAASQEAGAASAAVLPFLAGVATSTLALLAAGQLASWAPGPKGVVNPIRLGRGGLESPDTVLVGPGVVLLQLLLDYFHMGTHALLRCWPHITLTLLWRTGLANQLAVVIRRRMQPGLEQLQSATLRETRVQDLTLGDKPPLVEAVKVYDTGDGETCIADIAITWESTGRLQLAVSLTERGDLSVPVEVDDIKFKGIVRIVMTPALNRPPFLGAMTFSSVGTPNIDFRVRVLGGEVSAIPGLREQLMAYAISVTDATFTWPKRIVLPFRRVNDVVNMNVILSPDSIAAIRAEPFTNALSPDRVQAWGSRGLTRRIPRQYSNAVAVSNGRKSPWRRAADSWTDWRKRRAEEKAAAAALVQPSTPPDASNASKPGFFRSIWRSIRSDKQG